MKRILDLLLLADAYDRKARLTPAFLTVLPLTLAVGFFAAAHGNVREAAILWLLIQLVMTRFMAVLVRACGHRAEERLIASWGGLPTHRWLRPDNNERSAQLKQQWREAIHRLTDFDLSALAELSSADRRKLIDDAVAALRARLRAEEEVPSLLQEQNIEYGFARNLLGAWPIAAAFATIGTLACGWGALAAQVPLVAPVVEGCLLVGVLLIRRLLPALVAKAAERYADTLLSSAVAVAKEAP